MDHDHLFSHSNEIFEAMENMELKLIEMQMLYEEQSKKRLDLEKQYNFREEEFTKQRQELQQEILKLKKVYIHDMKMKYLKEALTPPLWLQNYNFEKEDIIAQLQEQNDFLQLSIQEKNTYIETCKWKLKEAETSITLLTAERTQLALEADELALRVDQYECALEFGKGLPVKKSSLKTARAEITQNKNCNSVTSINSVPDSEYDDFSDYETSGNALVRAANFTNICALDESLDFKLELDKLSVASGSDIPWPVTRLPSLSSLQNSCSITNLHNSSSHNSFLNIHDTAFFHSSNPNIGGKFDFSRTAVSQTKKEWCPFSSDTDITSDTSASSPGLNSPYMNISKRKRTSDVSSKHIDLFSDNFSKLTTEVYSASPICSEYDKETYNEGELYSSGTVSNNRADFTDFDAASRNHVVISHKLPKKKSEVKAPEGLESSTNFASSSNLIINNDKNELTTDQHALSKKFPIFSKGLNLSSNYSEDLKKLPGKEFDRKESNGVAVNLENSAESGIFCSDKSDCDIRSSTSSLCRHNSDCLPESTSTLLQIHTLTRNQSDPRFGRRYNKKNKKPDSLRRYQEWLDGGKMGKPPVQISEC